jgi:hypothetical protein
MEKLWCLRTRGGAEELKNWVVIKPRKKLKKEKEKEKKIYNYLSGVKGVV